MPLMFKSAQREHGKLQPHIRAGMFNIRLPLAMELTWMIQAFACFYIGTNMCRTSVERGVAGLTGGAIAVCPNPSIGLLIGVVMCIVMEFAGTGKADRAAQVASGLAATVQTNFNDVEE